MKALFTFFSILTVSLGYSQDVYWHQQLGSDTEETATAIASDADGNVFTTIRFSGTTTVGDTTFTSNGVNDIALVKLDENGEFVSAYHFGGSYDEYSLDLETDASGNVYWVGSSGGLDFAGTTYATQGGMDCMIAKWDNDLEPMWAKLGGSSQADRLYDCTVDAVGNVYFIGYMRENAVFDGISLSGLGNTDIVIGKIRPDGSLAWLRNDGGSTWDAGFAIAMVDDEYFVAGGEFINSANISGINLTSSTGGNDESWVAMFDTSGAGVWANKATNTGFNAVQSLAVDGDGYIYSGGYFEGTTDFEGDTSLTSNGDRDMYLVKYSPMAQLIWARSAGGTQFDQLRKVVANDSNEKIHVIGAFQETLTITPTDEIVSNGNYDVAILSVTNDGDLDWYEGIGGTENDQGYGLYNDAEGRVYASGFFSGSLLLDGETLTPSGPNDALVVKISPCEFPSLGFNTSVAQELCEGEELGVTLFNTETNVLYTIYADDEEADSDTQGLIELYLEVDEDDLEVGTNNITFGLLKEGCADEVFLDTTFLTEVYASPEADFSHMETSGMSDFTDLSTCSDAITAWEWDIEGDIYTSQNLSLSLSNDDYEVCLTVTSEFGCIDEACETITVLTGVQEYGGRSLNLRYDATNELLRWDSSGPLTVEVYDMSGRLVFGQYVNNQVDVSGLKRQMYVLRLLQKNELLVTGKFIK